MNTLLRACSWVRLGLVALLLLAAAITPSTVMPDAQPGVLVFVLLGAVAVTAALVLLRPMPLPPRAAWLVAVGDVALVTAVVGVTGASRTLFNSLYVLAIITACLLLSRVGGLLIAFIASLSYIGLVLASIMSPSPSRTMTPFENTALDVLTISFNVGAFLVIAVVAGGLADRSRATERQLASRLEDIGNLEAVRDLIFDSVGSGLVTLDRELTITAFNRAAEDLTGFPANEAVGLPWSAVFGSEVPVAAVHCAAADGQRASYRHELELKHADGRVVPVRVTFSSLQSPDGRRVGLIGVCEDLERIRTAEAEARHADRLATLGRMAANIAHEIRNPLASLTGAIEALTRKRIPDEAQERLVQIVLSESDRLNGTIKTFLRYARPAPLDPQAGNVADVLDDVLVLLEHRALPASLTVARDYPPHLPWEFDHQQLRQALWNLCLNAVEAMPEGGELRISARQVGDAVEVSVADTGEGIETTHLPHVFEPFFSTKSGEPGLGLALTHRIVKDHGGDIDVTSVSGAGTAFTFTLPRRHG